MTTKIIHSRQERTPLWSLRDLSGLLEIDYRSLAVIYGKYNFEKPEPVMVGKRTYRKSKSDHGYTDKSVRNLYFVKEEFLEWWGNRR